MCVLHRQQQRAERGALLYIHPFAEEMNKSRRAVAVAARELASAGWTVLQIDLFGCGDSTGGFEDATWELWLSDVAAGCKWLSDRVHGTPGLWGLRAGALLAWQAAARLYRPMNLLLWQPVISGRTHLSQFLRLKVVRSMSGDSAERSSTQALRDRLNGGAQIEIAGYMLSPSLAIPMEQAEIRVANGPMETVSWLETGSSAELAPASRECIARLTGAGVCVRTSVVSGLPFWQTTEIEESPALIAATLSALDTWPRAS